MAYGDLDDVLHPWRQAVAGPLDWTVAACGAFGAIVVGWSLGGVLGLVLVGVLAGGLAWRWQGIAVAWRIPLALALLRPRRPLDLSAAAVDETTITICTVDGVPIITEVHE